ncbi:unnamed protein product [Coregonus sp. 'balchen']|nr:unnamed protein product [Coregonus sp. 'balchen']
MDPSKEVFASEKERKPAGEESEEPFSKLLRTPSRLLTWSREKCRLLETEISRPEEELEVLKLLAKFNVDEQSATLPRTSSYRRLTMSEEECRELEAEISRMKVKLEVLKRTLEEMNPHELKTFQSFLTSGLLPDCPPIPERQLQNADRQDIVGQMVKRYGSERAVKITLRILRGMKQVDLAEKLETDHRGALLLTTLEELTGEQLKTFQSNLTRGNPFGFPPIPESQLENTDRQVTVGQMVKRYGPERVVEITLRILRGMDQNDLAKKLKRYYNRGNVARMYINLYITITVQWRSNQKEHSTDFIKNIQQTSLLNFLFMIPSMLDVPSLLLTTLEELTGEQLKTFQCYLTSVQLPGFSPIPESQLENADRQDTVDQMVKRYGPEGAVKITLNTMRKMDLGDLAEKLERDHRGATDGTMEEESQDCVRVHLSDSLPEAMDELSITECRVGDQSLCTTDPRMRSPENFEPEIYDNEGKGAYRFQCLRSGLFQCSITGLVFRMEGEGEVLYRTVPWDRRLLAKRGKRPAGPLFNIDCSQKSVCQLRLPHCQIHSDTHVIINITGFSAYGDVTDDDAPISPIHGLVLLFHQLFVPEERSILNVLLLPSNVVIREVQDVRKTRNGYKETLIETTPHCNLTPNKTYILSTNITHGYRINPTTAEFVVFQSDENYSNTFQLFLETVVKEFDLLLKEKGSTENVWNRLVWLPVSAVSLAAPPANHSTSTGRGFIRNHRMALETRLGRLQPILSHLEYHKALNAEEREEVVSKSTKTQQNQALLDMVVRKGARAQKHFYQVLKEVDPYLVEDLEEQTV